MENEKLCCAVCGDTCKSNLVFTWERTRDGKKFKVCGLCAETKDKVNENSVDNFKYGKIDGWNSTEILAEKVCAVCGKHHEIMQYSTDKKRDRHYAICIDCCSKVNLIGGENVIQYNEGYFTDFEMSQVDKIAKIR